MLTWGRGYACVHTPSGPLWIPARCIKPYHGVARTQPGTRNEENDPTGPVAPDDVASSDDTGPRHYLMDAEEDNSKGRAHPAPDTDTVHSR